MWLEGKVLNFMPMKEQMDLPGLQAQRYLQETIKTYPTSRGRRAATILVHSPFSQQIMVELLYEPHNSRHKRGKFRAFGNVPSVGRELINM